MRGRDMCCNSWHPYDPVLHTLTLPPDGPPTRVKFTVSQQKSQNGCWRQNQKLWVCKEYVSLSACWAVLTVEYRLAQTGTDWHRLVQTGTDWHRLVPTGTDWYRLAQFGRCLFPQNFPPSSASVHPALSSYWIIVKKFHRWQGILSLQTFIKLDVNKIIYMFIGTTDPCIPPELLFSFPPLTLGLYMRSRCHHCDAVRQAQLWPLPACFVPVVAVGALPKPHWIRNVSYIYKMYIKSALADAAITEVSFIRFAAALCLHVGAVSSWRMIWQTTLHDVRSTWATTAADR